MVATLREMLLAPEIRPQVVADCQALVKQELSAKSGLSGTAVKLAYWQGSAPVPDAGAVLLQDGNHPSAAPGRFTNRVCVVQNLAGSTRKASSQSPGSDCMAYNGGPVSR